MLFLLADSPQKLKLGKIHDTLIIFSNIMPSSPKLKRIGFFVKSKATTLHEVTRGNAPNLVLKRMLGHFLKFQPRAKMFD